MWYAKSHDYANWQQGSIGGVSVGVVWFHVYISSQMKISEETGVNMGIKSLQWN